MSGTGSGSGSGSGRHASQQSGGRGGRTAALVAGAVVVVALIAAAATGWPVDMPWSGDDSATQASSSASGGASASAGNSPSSGADSSGDGATAAGWLKTCAAQVAGEEKVVAAAADGVRDWHGHVQARTDMFAGRITQERMHDIWTRTKLAGPADQQRFEAVATKHPARSACSKPADVPAADRSMVKDCRARSKAAARAVGAAHAAMHDWQAHLTNMATYADGDMSETMAQDRWVASWRNAPTNISAYKAARAALDSAPACSAQAG